MTLLPVDPDRAPRPLFVLAEHYSPGSGPWHRHNRAQLIHASQGVIRVKTERGLWIVPPLRAVWILPGERHQVSSSRGFWLRSLYGEADQLPLPPHCAVINIEPLLNQLLIVASTFGPNYPALGPEQRLMDVIVDRLQQQPFVPSHLPMPQDPRLLRLVQLLEKNPADQQRLDQLAAHCGLSGRTAARLFRHQTKLTFGQWRQQLRLLLAIEMLDNGVNVTQAAGNVGYQDVSAFIVAFKNAFGTTPARYCQPSS